MFKIGDVSYPVLKIELKKKVNFKRLGGKMSQLFKVLFVVMSMICLLIEKCTCYQILVIGLLLGIMFELEQKTKHDKEDCDE